VEIDFVDSESGRFSPRDRLSGDLDCRFTFTSVARRSGTVQSLQHGLAANSSCSWKFQALPGEVVWFSFVRFRVKHEKPSIYRTSQCQQHLSLQDPHRQGNTSLGDWCETAPPLLCEQNIALNNSNFPRPCRPGIESYVSSGRSLTLIQTLGASSVEEQLDFEARYEFVSTTSSKDNKGLSTDCDHEYRSSQAGGGYGTQEHALEHQKMCFFSVEVAERTCLAY